MIKKHPEWDVFFPGSPSGRGKKKHDGYKPSCFFGADSGTRLHYGVASVQPSASDCPPDSRIQMGSRPSTYIKKKESPKGPSFFLVRIVGLEPTRRGHRNLNPTRLPIPSYPHTAIFYHAPGAMSIESAPRADICSGLFVFINSLSQTCGQKLRHFVRFSLDIPLPYL